MVIPDAHAALFASLTGLKTEQVQLSFAIFTAVLAIFAMSIANFFAAVLWARTANDLELEAMAPPTNGEIVPFKPLTIAYNKAATVSRKPADAAAGQPSTVGALPSGEPAAEQPSDDPLDQGEESQRCRQCPADNQRQSEAVVNLSERKHRQAVRRFFSEATVPSPASKADATEVYGAYRDWSKLAGLAPMSQKLFGLISAEIGVAKKRSKRNRKVTYQGFAIRRSADPAERLARA
jgi:hypothetical protein